MSQFSPHPAPNPEAQRLLLLQAMGIRSYYPRFQLPGALPSVACAWLPDEEPAPAIAAAMVPELGAQAAPEVAARAVTEADAAPTVAEPPEARVSPERHVAPVGDMRSAKVSAQPSPPQRQTAETASTLSFQVLLVLADQGLAICNQLPAVARPALGRSEQQLLNNMLLWLGCTLQPGASSRHFAWPLPGLAATDATLAGKGLQSFLAQAQQESGFTRLLLLGNSSVDCLQPQLDSAAQPWQTWCTHSLAELLALPALKRSAWQQLQTLHA